MSAATPTLQRSFGFYGQPSYRPAIKTIASGFDSESYFGVDTSLFQMRANYRILSNKTVLVAFAFLFVPLRHAPTPASRNKPAVMTRRLRVLEQIADG